MGDGANRQEGSRLAQVERQLAKQMELYNEKLAKVTKLQLDYNKVLNDYHAQLEVCVVRIFNACLIHVYSIRYGEINRLYIPNST